MQSVARIRMPENGVFLCRLATSLDVSPGDRCLAELDYGLDVGNVFELLTAEEENREGRLPVFRIVRKLGPDDTARLTENETRAERAKHAFSLSVAKEKGGVKLLHVRFSYGRERLFIRYSAQVPVDLRRFVGQIQRDFKTHIDLWQVGVRDETALVGCLGPCGRAVCCCTWQRQFSSVNVRMAKAQEMSINPVSVNGSCGRLKCCLKFEYEQYREAGRGLPESGDTVVFSDQGKSADGVVIGRDVLRGRLTVRTRDGRFLTLASEDVSVARAGRVEAEPKEGNEHERADREWTES